MEILVGQSVLDKLWNYFRQSALDNQLRNFKGGLRFAISARQSTIQLLPPLLCSEEEKPPKPAAAPYLDIMGNLTAIAAAEMGYRCLILEPQEGCPASHVADHIAGAYEDEAVLAKFADACDVITLEFENPNPDTVSWLRWLGNIP